MNILAQELEALLNATPSEPSGKTRKTELMRNRHQRLARLINDHGPQTIKQVAAHLGITYQAARWTLMRMDKTK